MALLADDGVGVPPTFDMGNPRLETDQTTEAETKLTTRQRGIITLLAALGAAAIVPIIDHEVLTSVLY